MVPIKVRPDIRQLTRLVPASGNLVQGQSELDIDPDLARAAEVGFQIYNSGSAFYLWARIPEGFEDAMQLNEMLISRAGVAGVPGSAFGDSDRCDHYMRFCIAREDEILQGALDKLRDALAKRL